MKKKIMLMLAFLLIVVPGKILAKEYTIKDLNFSIEINDDWDVFTTENAKNNDNFKKYDLPEDYFDKYFEKNNVYLFAIDKDFNNIVLKIEKSNVINNLSNYTKSEIEGLGLEAQKENNADTYKILKNNKITYINTSYYNKNLEYNFTDYSTVVNRKYYTVSLRTKNSLTNKEEIALENIVKTINIDVIKDFKYEDGTTFLNKPEWIIFIGVLLASIVILSSTLIKKKKKTKKKRK